jgi:hypothetical protein
VVGFRRDALRIRWESVEIRRERTVMVRTKSVEPPNEVGVGVMSDGASVGEGKAELTSGVVEEDSIGTLELSPSLETSDSTGAVVSTEVGAVIGSGRVSVTLDADASDAVPWADEIVTGSLNDGTSSIDGQAIIWEDAEMRVEVSEDGDGPTETETVEEARSPSWDDGEGVDDMLNPEEAEGDSVAIEASSCEDDDSRVVDSEVEEGSAGAMVELPSSWAVDMGEETTEFETADKEAVILGAIESLAPMPVSIDPVG